MKILVTGASGLIGSNLVSALQQEGHTIRVTYRNHISDFGENVEYFKGDFIRFRILYRNYKRYRCSFSLCS